MNETRKNKMEQLRNRALTESMKNMASPSTLDSSEDTPLLGLVNELKAKNTNREIIECDPNDLLPYPNEKIRLSLHTGYKRETMKESIKIDGILEPALVRVVDNKKYIMAGHNRNDIAKEMNIKIPCIFFYNIDDKKADRIVVITNLQNRQYNEMKTSELISMLQALIDTYDENSIKEEIYEDINSEFNLSKRKVKQYLKMANLIPEFMDMLDEKNISIYVGYELAFAKHDKQKDLHTFMIKNNIKSISMKQIDQIMKREIKEWDDLFLSEVFGLVKKKRQSKVAKVYINVQDLSPYMSTDEIKNIGKTVQDMLEIRKYLQDYCSHNNLEFSLDNLKELLEK